MLANFFLYIKNPITPKTIKAAITDIAIIHPLDEDLSSGIGLKESGFTVAVKEFDLSE